MKKVFTPSPHISLPSRWISAPKRSPPYALPPPNNRVSFIFAKMPISEKMMVLFDFTHRWSPKSMIQEIEKIFPPNDRPNRIVAIDLLKRPCQIPHEEWVNCRIMYERVLFDWKTPMENIRNVQNIVIKHSHIQNQIMNTVFIVFSKYGFNKPLFSVAGMAAQNSFNSLISVITSLCLLHPPGLTNNKAIESFSSLFQKQLPIQVRDLPNWLLPMPDFLRPDSNALSIIRYNFPGLTEIGATKASKNDSANIKKIIVESTERNRRFNRNTATQIRAIWNQTMMKDVLQEPHRITFEPEGSDVIIVINGPRNQSFLYDSNGETWQIPLESSLVSPIVITAVLQRRKIGGFMIIVTDVIKAGEISFLEDDVDSRMAYCFHYIVEEVKPRAGCQLELCARPLGLLKDGRKLLRMLSKLNMRCSGLSLVPVQQPPGRSIFIPAGETLVPFQASANSPTSLVLYSMDDDHREYIPVGVSKIEPELSVLDGVTVLCSYQPKTHTWEVKKYSQDLQCSLASFSAGIAAFRTFDLEPIEILKHIESALPREEPR